MADAAKKFDPSKPHGTVHGNPAMAFFQNGEHYDAKGNLYVPPVDAADSVEAEVQRRVSSELDQRVAVAVAAALAAQGAGKK